MGYIIIMHLKYTLLMINTKKHSNIHNIDLRVHTGKIVHNSRPFQGLLKDCTMVYKNYKVYEITLC